jgi:hypothetical protein
MTTTYVSRIAVQSSQTTPYYSPIKTPAKARPELAEPIKTSIEQEQLFDYWIRASRMTHEVVYSTSLIEGGSAGAAPKGNPSGFT